MFQPSPHSYGAEQSSADALLQTVQDYAPLVQAAAEASSDANRQIELLSAKIKNAQALLRRTPVGREILKARIRNLKARKRAAERKLSKQQESESSTRTYRALGQVGIVVGVGIGVAIIIRLLRR